MHVKNENENKKLRIDLKEKKKKKKFNYFKGKRRWVMNKAINKNAVEDHSATTCLFAQDDELSPFVSLSFCSFFWPVSVLLLTQSL